jgi:hypothetical protein
MTDQLARHGSSHPLKGPVLAFGISEKVARGVIRDWVRRKQGVLAIHS